MTFLTSLLHSFTAHLLQFLFSALSNLHDSKLLHVVYITVCVCFSSCVLVAVLEEKKKRVFCFDVFCLFVFNLKGNQTEEASWPCQF